jgi:hypothetical protein
MTVAPLFALRASDGAMVWTFYSTYPHGTSFTDVNGNTFDAGDTFTTKVTPNDTPNNCYLTAGAAAWQPGTIDPELGMIYVAFGNVRSCTGSQNGEGRPGDNLFGSSVVALDYKTGAYKWHFQAVRHDIWDMDNALIPALADVVIGGQTRKVMFYGSKSGFQFTLDRTNGKPALPIEMRPVPGDSRNFPAPTQPWPLQSRYNPLCVVLQNLGSEVPGDQNRMAPNWNGYQAEPDPANPGQLKLVYRTPNYLSAQEPFMTGPPRAGCLYDGSYENFVYLFPPSQNGGNDMTNTSMSPKLNMRYVGLSFMPGAHPLQQGGNGLRMIGGYQSGAILGVDNSTGEVVWYERLKFDLSRQHNPLVTATDLLFHTQMDGWLVGRDAATGKHCGASKWVRRARPAPSRMRSTASSTSRRRTWPAASRIRKAATVSRSGPSSSAARRSTTPVRAPIRPSSPAAAKPRLRCRSRTGVVRWTTPRRASFLPARSGWHAPMAPPPRRVTPC